MVQATTAAILAAEADATRLCTGSDSLQKNDTVFFLCRSLLPVRVEVERRQFTSTSSPNKRITGARGQKWEHMEKECLSDRGNVPHGQLR